MSAWAPGPFLHSERSLPEICRNCLFLAAVPPACQRWCAHTIWFGWIGAVSRCGSLGKMPQLGLP